MRVYQQVGPHTWRWETVRDEAAKRSDLPLPYVISDIMEPVEQVDGKFYSSKRAFRAVGRALGLTEVGTEKPKPKKPTDDPVGRRAAIKTAVEKVKAGHRAR